MSNAQNPTFPVGTKFANPFGDVYVVTGAPKRPGAGYTVRAMGAPHDLRPAFWSARELRENVASGHFRIVK